MTRLLRRLLAIVAFVGVAAYLLAGAVDQEFASAGASKGHNSGSFKTASPGVMSERDHRGGGTDKANVVRYGLAPVRTVSAPLSSWAYPSARSESTYQGKPIRWWARRAVQNKKDSLARGRTIKRMKVELRRKYEPTFEHYFTIAALTYRVDRTMLERKGRCESVDFTDFYNETPIYNGEHAQGVMGFIPSTFNSSSFRGLDVRYDHLANIMAGAELHARGRGGEWACR